MTGQTRPHPPPQHADTFAVNDLDASQAAAAGVAEELIDHAVHFSRRDRVQVELVGEQPHRRSFGLDGKRQFRRRRARQPAPDGVDQEHESENAEEPSHACSVRD